MSVHFLNVDYDNNEHTESTNLSEKVAGFYPVSPESFTETGVHSFTGRFSRMNLNKGNVHRKSAVH